MKTKMSLKEAIRNSQNYNIPIIILEDTGMSYEELSIADLIKNNTLDKYEPFIIDVNDALCRVEIKVKKISQ